MPEAMGILYIVSTPIGNLKDVTLRAIEILDSVAVIACEDTRRTGVLLQNILPPRPQPEDRNEHPEKRKLLSYFDHNEFKRIPEILQILKNGDNVALVSDAGTPTISDPGFKLVRACIEEGIKVEAIPGASSVLTALAVSGLPTDKFLFLGYLPRKQGNRTQMLANSKASLEVLKSTVIIFEAPHRLVQTLLEIEQTFGNIDIVLTRELTKIHEEIRRENIKESIKHFNTKNPKGEFVILFNIHNQKEEI